MEDFSIPVHFKMELAKINQAIDDTKAQYEKVQEMLKNLSLLSREQQGQFNGVIRSIAMMANFDVNKDLQVDLEYKTLKGIPLEEDIPVEASEVLQK